MLVPKLRFKEFNEEWSSYLLEDLVDFKNGLNKEKEAFGLGTPIINYMDVNKNENITKSLVKGLVTLTNKEKDNYNVKKGDIFFTRTSETAEEIGLSSSLIEDIDQCVFSGFVLRGRAKKKTFYDKYPGYYFRTRKMRDEIIKHSSITTRALTSGTLLNSLQICIPSIQEQTKIADFLSLLDRKIKLQQEKIDALKLYKKGLILSIFNENLRFNNYPCWQNHKIADIAIFNSNKISNIKNFKKITIGLNHTGIRFFEESRTMTDTRPFYLRDKGEIILGKQNYFNGSIAIITEIFDKTICSNAILSFKTIDTVNNLFVYYYLSNPNYYKKRASLANGTGQKELSDNDFRNFDIRLPALEEQDKIAYFLNCFDKKLSEEHKKVIQIMSLKKGLMQNMFV